MSMGLIERFLIPMRGILAHPLGRRHPVAALRRFAAWQMRSRFGASFDVPFVNEAQLRVARGMTGLTGNLYTGLHEFESMGFLLHLLRPGDLFVDIGANAGSYTVLAAKAIGCRVVAVEPDGAALDALRANVALNRVAAGVDIHEVVLSDREGQIDFTMAQGTENHVAIASDAGQAVRSARTRTLDVILAGRVPCLIKMDVEGYELKVLQGARNVLSSGDLLGLIVEINGCDTRYQFSAAELVALLQQQGFSAHAYDPLRRSLLPVDALGADGNVIFVRDRASIERHLVSAPPFVLPGWGLSI